MTLLISLFAAIISTILWYTDAEKRQLKVGTLCWLYWGASLMWLVDAVFEYAELGAEYFRPVPTDMLNDFYLGLSVVALGLVIWLVVLMIQDPKGVLKETLFRSGKV